MKKKKKEEKKSVRQRNSNQNIHAYFIGGGLSSLAGAFCLIKEYGFRGENIHIIESQKEVGGSNHISGDAIGGYVTFGDSSVYKKQYDAFWKLYAQIPSLEMVGSSVKQEILHFNRQHPLIAKRILIDPYGHILNGYKMGLKMGDICNIIRLFLFPDKLLYGLEINSWFKKSFFNSNFWIILHSTYCIKKNSGLLALKNCIKKNIKQHCCMRNMKNGIHTPYNEYEALILPLLSYLELHNVDMQTNLTVTDLYFSIQKPVRVRGIEVCSNESRAKREIKLGKKDVCFLTNGCRTDSFTLGDRNMAPEYNTQSPIGAHLWRRVSHQLPHMGNMEPFFEHPVETSVEKFTITLKGNRFLKLIQKFTHNNAGSTGLITFTGSNWMLNVTIPVQPYFKDQPIDTTVVWGYGLHTDKTGNYVKKFMKDCTGEEILTELVYHFHFEDQLKEILKSVINVIPCMMPYLSSQFQPAKEHEKPCIIPKGTAGLAVIGQFVRQNTSSVYTENFAIETAKYAISSLLKK